MSLRKVARVAFNPRCLLGREVVNFRNRRRLVTNASAKEESRGAPHTPVLLSEVLFYLDPKPGMVSLINSFEQLLQLREPC